MNQESIGNIKKDDIGACEKAYSGRISLRIPKELHKELIEAAAQNNVSLNQFILYKLSKH